MAKRTADDGSGLPAKKAGSSVEKAARFRIYCPDETVALPSNAQRATTLRELWSCDAAAMTNFRACASLLCCMCARIPLVSVRLLPATLPHAPDWSQYRSDKDASMLLQHVGDADADAAAVLRRACDVVFGLLPQPTLPKDIHIDDACEDKLLLEWILRFAGCKSRSSKNASWIVVPPSPRLYWNLRKLDKGKSKQYITSKAIFALIIHNVPLEEAKQHMGFHPLANEDYLTLAWLQRHTPVQHLTWSPLQYHVPFVGLRDDESILIHDARVHSVFQDYSRSCNADPMMRIAFMTLSWNSSSRQFDPSLQQRLLVKDFRIIY